MERVFNSFVITHCINGHEFTEENTIWSKNSKSKHGKVRQCRECRKRAVFVSRLKRHNLQEDIYNKLFYEQEGKCAICKSEKITDIDHCHDLNEVRGLLCKSCNLGLGFFKNNVTFMKSAIEYLDKK